MNKIKKEIINFYVPVELKNRFDSICRETNQTRTFALLNLMKKFVIEEGLELTKIDNQFNKIDNHINERKKVMDLKDSIKQQEQELPIGFINHGDHELNF